MDIQGSDGEGRASEHLPVSLSDGQYAYVSQSDSFEANLAEATEYCASHTVSTQDTTITPLINALAYNEAIEPHPEIALSVQSSDISNDCITYGNVVFVPAIINDDNQHAQLPNAIELIKNETNAQQNAQHDVNQSVLSSSSSFVNTFLQASNIDGTESAVLCEASAQAFNETNKSLPADAIANDASGIPSELGQIDQHQQAMYQIVHSNHVDIGAEPEVILQDEHGQLYRTVQNIYVDDATMCSSGLLPMNANIISTPIDISSNAAYVGCDNDQVHLQAMQNTYQPANESSPYEIPVNFISAANSTETSNAINTNNELQEVQFIFDGYGNNINQSNAVVANQFHIGSNAEVTNYQNQTQFEMQSNKEQQSLLESTMSTLLAAVNDIAAREKQLEAAREEQQFQSYLNNNTNSNSITDPNIDYYTDDTQSVDSASIYKNSADAASGDQSKSLTLTSITNELFQHGCDPTTADEYVDINEMEFIEQKNDEGQLDDNNLLMRRANRKKTTKRKDDELLIVDKFVPSRARASLPTSYLYFEASHDVSPNKEQNRVLAKRQIPLHMKFGPVVGDARQLNNQQLHAYRDSNSDYPVLFSGDDCVLDVSNQNTSNWMRFVRRATSYNEQNLLLYELNGELYFKCCKSIAPNEELRIGYSKEYAAKYDLLDQFYPEPIELVNYLCKKCDEQFESDELLQIHQNTKHKTKESRIALAKNGDNVSPTKSKDRLNTDAIRMRKLALSKKSRTSGPIVRYACMYCTKVFSKFLSYKKHTKLVHSVNIDNKRVTIDQHKRLTVEDSIEKISTAIADDPNDNVTDTKHLFVCQRCQRQFAVAKELEEHLKSSCTAVSTTQCHICLKQLQTPKGLLMHIKTHSSNAANGMYKCPFCSQRYQNTVKFKLHVKIHMTDGVYKCPHCSTEFPKYSSIRKHIKIIHTSVRFVCLECGKDFKSKYKLKEHTLSHSDVRQFSCADCDKQFKRKDKLRDHILRIHAKNSPQKKQKKSKGTIDNVDGKNEDNESAECAHTMEGKDNSMDAQDDDADLNDLSAKSKFQPKVPPTDYERFIYKCQHCLLGFKRRGMLVNHMAKRHPDIRIDSIHELNLPILKTERCFYCQYCEKVYKSSSKRKAHILKYHPGQKLPQSTRRGTGSDGSPVEADPSFSANIGSITTHAHQCKWCYKQYASRSRLLQHKRKAHSAELEESYKQSQNDYFKDLNMIMDSHGGSQFNNQCIDDYAMRFDEMAENVSNSVHRFHQIEYEPNRLLELSSAALESMGDDYSFLSDNEVNSDVIGHEIMDPRVDVNFKCDSNTLPHLFDGFLQ